MLELGEHKGNVGVTEVLCVGHEEEKLGDKVVAFELLHFEREAPGYAKFTAKRVVGEYDDEAAVGLDDAQYFSEEFDEVLDEFA